MLVHGSVRYKWQGGASSLEDKLEAIHTVVDSVLGHAIKTTVENLAAKHSVGGDFFLFLFFGPNRRYSSLGVVELCVHTRWSLEGDETRGFETYSARGHITSSRPSEGSGTYWYKYYEPSRLTSISLEAVGLPPSEGLQVPRSRGEALL